MNSLREAVRLAWLASVPVIMQPNTWRRGSAGVDKTLCNGAHGLGYMQQLLLPRHAGAAEKSLERPSSLSLGRILVERQTNQLPSAGVANASKRLHRAKASLSGAVEHGCRNVFAQDGAGAAVGSITSAGEVLVGRFRRVLRNHHF